MWIMWIPLWGLWFWFFSGIWFIATIYAIDEELGGLAFISIVAYLLVLTLFSNIPIWAFIAANPQSILLAVVAYFVIGFVWSFCKYYFKAKNMQLRIKRAVEKYEIYKTKQEEREEEGVPSFKEWLRGNYDYNDVRDSMDFSKSVTDSLFHAAYWPISFVWTMLSDPFTKVVKYMYNHWFIGTYRAIHKKVVLGSVPEEYK